MDDVDYVVVGTEDTFDSEHGAVIVVDWETVASRMSSTFDSVGFDILLVARDYGLAFAIAVFEIAWKIL